MSERLDSIRRRAGKYCLLGADDALYLLRRLDRERDVTERMTGAWIVSRPFAEDESRRERPDLWQDDCDDGNPCTGEPCAKANSAPVAPDPATTTPAPAKPCNDDGCEPATSDLCDVPAHTWSGWRKSDEHSLPPLTVMLPPPPPCPTCGGQMGYVAMTVPGRPRCFRCEPEPSQWREGPPPEEFGWVWFPDDGVWPAQGLPGDTITTTRDDGILRWQHDWRWMPLETPAPPEVTP